MTDASRLFEFVPDGVITQTHIFIPGIMDWSNPDAPEPLPMPRDRDAWQQWARQVLVHRHLVSTRAVRDLSFQQIQKALCQQPNGLGVCYFLLTFGWIYEPRADGDMAMAPFILYPRQAELLMALDGAMQRPKGQYSSVAIPKARGVGATWLDMGDHLHRWLFKKNYQGRVVSRNEDMVDKKGSSDAVMWKIDYLADKLPYWLLPEDYSPRNKAHRAHMTMLNPTNNNAILGEATTSGIGVGGRGTKYTLDEASRESLGKNLDTIWGQLGETTDHRVAISTYDVTQATHFWDLCNGLNGWTPPLVIPMPWQANLLRDRDWLEETRKTMRADLFEQEIMMNPWAGISTWVYPEAKEKVPADRPYRSDGGLVYHGLDDGWDDEFAIVWVQRQGEKWVVLDAYQNSHKTIPYYGHLLRGELPGSYQWDDEAVRIARWAAEHETWRGHFYGDRHGDNTDITSGTSAWQTLRSQFRLNVMTNPPNRNTYKDRREAMGEWLLHLEFNDTPGALMALEYVQNHRFPAPRAGAQPTNEYRKPVHGPASHLTTALEYIAGHVISLLGTAPADRDHPTVHRNDFLSPGRRELGRRNSPHRENTYQWLTH